MSESFAYEPKHDPDYEVINGEKVLITNEAKKKNLEQLNFREYLEKHGLIGKKELITQEEFKRVHEIAYLNLIRDEDIVPVAVLDFLVNRLRGDGYGFKTIYEDIEEEVSIVVRRYLGNVDKDLLFQIVTSSIVDSSEYKNFAETLFKKMEERRQVSLSANMNISVSDGVVRATDETSR